jgi:glyoxylase-like metal-dependent hydrolase (beta-lactamase superfamily II)
MRWCLLPLLPILILSPVVAGQDAKAVVAQASQVMGVTALESITLAGTAAYGNFGQSRSLSFGLDFTTIRNYNLTIDFTRGIMHAVGEAAAPGAPNGVPPGRFDELITDTSPGARQLEIWTTPWGFLRGAAAARDVKLSARKVDGVSYRVVEWQTPFTSASGRPYRIVGYISPDWRVDKVETWIDHPLMGDLQVMFTYSGYADTIGGLKVPVRVSRANIGMEVSVAGFTFAAPDPEDLEQLLRPTVPPRPTAALSPIVPERLAEGVYLLTGGYDALAVDLKDQAVVIGGGGDEARGLALLAETQRLFPGKRVRYAVSLHGHFDHALVLPAFASAGITLLADDQNRYFLQESLLIPRTLLGDALAASRRKPAIEGIMDTRVLGDAARRVELHHLKRVPHADGMLAAFLPGEKLLFVSDIELPAEGDQPGESMLALLENLDRLGLDFDLMISNSAAGSARLTKAELFARVPSLK